MKKDLLQRDPWHVRGVRNSMAIFMLAVLTWTLVMSGISRLNPVLSYIQCFLLSLTLVYLLTPLAKSFSFWFSVLDIPEARKIHVCPVPLLGGAPIAFAYVFSLYYTFVCTQGMKAILLACLLIYFVGLIDDVAGVSATKRMILQLSAVALLLVGGVRMSFLPDTWWGNIGEICITALWVIGIINTFNFLDGLDGLAAGLAVISSFGFAVAGIMTGQSTLTLMALPLCGACLAFLRFNFHPASKISLTRIRHSFPGIQTDPMSFLIPLTCLPIGPVIIDGNSHLRNLGSRRRGTNLRIRSQISN